MADLDIGTLRGFITLQDGYSPAIDEIAKKVGIGGESFKALAGFAAGAVGAIAGATAAIVALGVRGAEINDVQDAFDGLAQGAGSTADAMLGALQTATLGTISNFDLMKMSTGVLSTGLITSAEDMGTLAAGAKLLADRTGGDTAEAFNTLTAAMATGRTGSLKQLGLFVDTGGAAEAYAKSIGKTSAQLSDHEKATAAAHATLAALKGQLDAAGPATADFGDNIKRGQVAVQNFVDDLAKAIATSPVVAAGMGAMQDALREAFGGKSADMVSTLMGWVNKFAIGLTYVGQAGVVAATVLVTAWFGIQTAILGVMTAVSAVGTGIVALVSGLANLGAAIPGVGQFVEGFANGAAKLRENLDATTTSLAAQTVEAAKGVMGHSAAQAAIDKVGGALVGMRDKMEAAEGKQALLTEGTKPLKTAIKDLGTAIESTWSSEMNDALEMMGPLFQAAEDKALEFRDRFIGLQDEITLANHTGLDARLIEIQQQQATQLADAQTFADGDAEIYAALSDKIIEKYGIQTEAAKESFADQAAAATHAGDTQLEVGERVLARALERYDAIKAKAGATEAEIAAEQQKWADAKDKVEQIKHDAAIDRFDMIAKAASSILGSIFGKNKKAAIAAAIIDTAAAVVTSFRNGGGWPWGLVPAAAMLAAGLVQIKKIESTSYATGSPGTAFEDFGRGSAATLHGNEAVINMKQGGTLAGMIGDEIRAARGGGQGGEQSGGPVGGDVYLDGLAVGRWLARNQRAGNILVPA